MSNYYTPGVYVEEVSTLPPSVVEGSTAIPAFLGYTKQTTYNGIDRKLIPTRISTMLEFKQYFGGPPPTKVTAVATMDVSVPVFSNISSVDVSPYTLYYTLDLFFKNGGSYCYIVALGEYAPAATTKKMDAGDFTKGLTKLQTEDEPTLIVLTEACALGAADYYTLCTAALAQCAKVKNRFCILDIPPISQADKDLNKNDVDEFRTGVGNNNLQYGAVYYPYLKTSLGLLIEDADVTVKGIKKGTTAATDTDLKTIKPDYTGVYAAIKNELNGPKYKVTLPASAAVAGVYATVDNDRGVWKAPANVSLNSVIEPAIKITADDQNKLNVDAIAGKSVNAIRSFTGKGILVWGARTLAGNDNEWRYVSVRRLFNLIEDSTSKASAFAVFEPNDATTWLKVQSMIDSYLYSLWQQGALAGSTAKQAYFVKVGLGSTMTTQDILEGRMIVEIGVAAVRPAEFIILKFSHKLQEA